MFTMLLNNFYQMAQVILYAFINEAKQHAVWQETSTIHHYINSIFNVWVCIHHIYVHIHTHSIYLHVYKGPLQLLTLPHNHMATQDKDVTASHHPQSKH